MNRYALLIPGDEDVWDRSTDEDKRRIHTRHLEFQAALAARGHTVLLTSELAHSRDATVVRRGSVTQGPFAESVEQLAGFYLVETADRADLLEVVAMLTEVESAIEVRAFGSNDAD
ncbi:MAG: transcription initiation protein [Nocardioidaceae bacterium]|nr:transcription initiation protein [Nocardioidaceae bacterium]